MRTYKEEALKEEWCLVVENNNYEVSNLGRVRRHTSGINTQIGKILRPGSTPKGYAIATLYQSGEATAYSLHSLVMRAFVGARPVGKNINHKDGDKINNRLDNLEYCTPSENSLHAIETGLQIPLQGEAHGNAKYTDKDILKIKRLFREGKTRKEIAATMHTPFRAVCKIIIGDIWSHVKEDL